MIRAGMVALAVSLLAGLALAQPPQNYRVVFDVTGPQERWEGVLNNVENLRKALGADKVQVLVVVHGKALGMVQGTNVALAPRMKSLAASGVTFAACQNTMNKMKVTREDLLPFVTVVDSGLAEIVRRQHEGWAYVNVGM